MFRIKSSDPYLQLYFSSSAICFN